MDTVFILQSEDDSLVRNDGGKICSFSTPDNALVFADTLRGRDAYKLQEVALPTRGPLPATDLSANYDRKIKSIIDQQKLKLANGLPPEEVMLSERDFMTNTNAYRGNEEIWFKKSWNVIAPQLLKPFEFEPAKRGPRTKYYLPA